MTKSKHTGGKGKAANIKAGKPERSRGKALNDKDLDHASGGLNPQPLPPLQIPKY